MALLVIHFGGNVFVVKGNNNRIGFIGLYKTYTFLVNFGLIPVLLPLTTDT